MTNVVLALIATLVVVAVVDGVEAALGVTLLSLPVLLAFWLLGSSL